MAVLLWFAWPRRYWIHLVYICLSYHIILIFEVPRGMTLAGTFNVLMLSLILVFYDIYLNSITSWPLGPAMSV